MNVELDFEGQHRLVREIIETVVLTLLMFFVIRLAVQNYNIVGHSMEPGLHDTELVLVDKWTYIFHPPAHGDVVVFDAPPQPGTNYIKRIIGIPGDSITITNGVPTVDGVTLKEFYVAPQNLHGTLDDKPVNKLIVPPDEYFVMGDNRGGSYDSRAWGLLPRSKIVGRASLVYWPWGQDNDGFLPNATSVFSTMSQAHAAHLSRVDMQSAHVIDMNTGALLAMPTLFVVCSWYTCRTRW